MRSKLIALEGPDCVGKGTQSRLLVKSLQNMGIDAIRVEPTKEGNQRMRRAIYDMLVDGRARRFPNSFQFLQFVNRIYFQLFKLPKLAREHDVVVLDRWSLSGHVYGSVEGVSHLLLAVMHKLARKPHLTIVLVGKSYNREEPKDSYEKNEALQSAVRRTYRSLGAELPNHVVIDNHDSLEKVQESIVALLANRGLVQDNIS